MVREFRNCGVSNNLPWAPSRTVQGLTTVADLAQLDIDGVPIEPIGDGGRLIGNARVSTRDQKLHRQVDALIAVGCQRIFEE